MDDKGPPFISITADTLHTNAMLLKKRKLPTWNHREDKYLIVSNHMSITGPLGQRRMYNTLKQTYSCLHMAKDDQVAIAQCESSAHNGNRYKQKRHSEFFSANEPLDFIVRDLLGPQPNILQTNQYFLVITDRFPKLTRAISASKTTASHVANLFFKLWKMPFGLFTYLSIINEPQ